MSLCTHTLYRATSFYVNILLHQNVCHGPWIPLNASYFFKNVQQVVYYFRFSWYIDVVNLLIFKKYLIVIFVHNHVYIVLILIGMGNFKKQNSSLMLRKRKRSENPLKHLSFKKTEY